MGLFSKKKKLFGRKKFEVVKINELPKEIPTEFLFSGWATHLVDNIECVVFDYFMVRRDSDKQTGDLLLLTGENAGTLYKGVPYNKKSGDTTFFVEECEITPCHKYTESYILLEKLVTEYEKDKQMEIKVSKSALEREKRKNAAWDLVDKQL